MVDFTWFPLEVISKEPGKGGTYRLMRDYYWIVDEQNRIPVYRQHSLQCNPNKEIVESIIAGKLYMGMNVRAVFLEKAWIPIECSDYNIKLRESK